ncbi:hypothetical protein VDG1235_2495 [Verrucomicrobiia bacterium DG1235]|nr:hypothetical protein VDG1235_2495 [Verrucomicrobiae bacterium DG1235]
MRFHEYSLTSSHNEIHSIQNSDTVTISTMSDGRIPLYCDWSSIMLHAGSMPDFYVQTRHRYARLVARVTADSLSCSFAQSNCRLSLSKSTACSVNAFVERCPCCSSPGRIEFQTTSGEEFIQICPSSATPANKWGRLVQSLQVAPRSAAINQFQTSPFSSELPSQSLLTPLHPTLLGKIIGTIADSGGNIQATLSNDYSFHCREIQPASIEANDTFLAVYSDDSTFQIVIQAARHVYLDLSRASPGLTLSGPQGEPLLTIAAAKDELSKDCFLETLEELIPELL